MQSQPSFRLPLLVAAILLFAAPALHAQTRTERDTPRPEVRDLVMEGVRSVDEDELVASIETRESECRSMLLRPICAISRSSLLWHKYYLEQRDVREDMLRIRVFYWQRGFRGATVDTLITEAEDEGVRVQFTVDEGEPTLVSRLEVRRPDHVLPDNRLQRLLRIRAGEPLNLLSLDSTRVLLRNALWDEGYADAVVNADTIEVAPDGLSATALISIDPRWQARIGSIRITGHEKVSSGTVLNSLNLREGDLYRRRDLLRSQRTLYESNLFRRASIIHPPQGDSIKTIEVVVSEALLRDARVSGGFSTMDFVQLESRYINYNWTGGARRLTVNGAVGNLFASGLNGAFIFRDVLGDIEGERAPFLRPTWRASMEVRQPWFLSPQNQIAVGTFAHRRAAPGIFVDRSFGGSATFTREVAIRAPISLTYRFEITGISAGDVYFCVNVGVCDLPTIGALRARQRLSPLALTGTVERTNDAFSPTAGYNARFGFEHGSRFTGSDYQYNRAVAQGALFRRLGRGVFATQARLGWVASFATTPGNLDIGDPTLAQDILHPRKRFYAGGSQSVRGYGENQLGPRVLTVAPEPLIENGCDLTREVDQCPAGVLNDVLGNQNFVARPVGGTSVVEGSVEYRFPIWRELGGAVFVDGAILGEGSLRDLLEGTAAITPGFGFRYYSPVGPIRIDLGINPLLSEDLEVLTEVRENGERRIVNLQRTAAGGQVVPHKRSYSPGSELTGYRKVLSHLTLHLSIGQAF